MENHFKLGGIIEIPLIKPLSVTKKRAHNCAIIPAEALKC